MSVKKKEVIAWQVLSFFSSERGNKETQLADVLSPVSKKKTGRAYVALARAHSEKLVFYPKKKKKLVEQ